MSPVDNLLAFPFDAILACICSALSSSIPCKRISFCWLLRQRQYASPSAIRLTWGRSRGCMHTTPNAQGHESANRRQQHRRSHDITLVAKLSRRQKRAQNIHAHQQHAPVERPRRAPHASRERKSPPDQRHFQRSSREHPQKTCQTVARTSAECSVRACGARIRRKNSCAPGLGTANRCLRV